MKKLHALIIALCALCISSATALEFGGLFDNTASLKLPSNDFSNFTFTDVSTITANVRQPFNEDGTFYLAAEGFARYSLSLSSSSTLHLITLDLPLLKIGATINLSGANSIILSVGRFSTADATQLVLAQPIDGALAQFRLGRVNVQATAGFTGFINERTTTLLSSTGKAFYADTDIKYIYQLSAPYLVTELAVNLPYILFNQTITVEVLDALGFNELADKTNRFYGTLQLSGPLAPTLFYKTSTTFETVDFKTLSNLSNFELSFYYPKFKSSRISLNATYASGATADDEDIAAAFSGITAITAVQASAPKYYSSLFKTGLSASLKPLDSLLVSLGADVVFKTGESFDYNGIAISGGAKYQPFSDLAISLAANSYIAKQKSDSATSVTLKATISF